VIPLFVAIRENAHHAGGLCTQIVRIQTTHLTREKHIGGAMLLGVSDEEGES